MFIIACLGNTGREYELTRHNIGFEIADGLIKSWGFSGRKKAFKSTLTSGKLPNGTPVHILKPETYMNRSGEAIQACAAFYKCPPENIIVGWSAS